MTKQISISKKDIENTEVFKILKPMQQKFVICKTTVLHIQHGVNVSINTSFENWQNQTAFNATNQGIVKELVKLKSKSNGKQ